MQVKAFPKPLLAFVVGNVHRGLLTLHFFNKSALVQQIKTKCWYKRFCMTSKTGVLKGELLCGRKFWTVTLWGHFKKAQKPGTWAEPATSVTISFQRKLSVWTGGGRLLQKKKSAVPPTAKCGKRRKLITSHMVFDVSLPLVCLNVLTHANICVALPVNTFVSVNFHSSRRVIADCNISKVLELSLSDDAIPSVKAEIKMSKFPGYDDLI